MESRALRYFVAVAEERSFRRAAQRLHLSQPPLTRQIKALEEELGVVLLERSSGRAVTLTPAGHIFLADAKQAIASLENARRHVQEFAKTARNRLSIVNYSELSVRVLPALLQAFQADFPQGEVAMIEKNGTEGFAALLTGQAQVGLVADHGLEVDDGLQAEALLEVALLAVLPADHPLAEPGLAEPGLEDLAGMTILYKNPEHAPCYNQRVPELFARANVTPRALRAVDGTANLLAMVAAGYGAAILPDVLEGRLRAGLCCKRLRLPTAVPPLRLSMVWVPGRPSIPVQRFLCVARQWPDRFVEAGKAVSAGG